VFERGGAAALIEEMQVDQTRLWQRNLGRDDRCVSDTGREAWFPYLDEELVSLLQSLNLKDIADMSMGQGEGDKLILRDAARLIGLTQCTTLVKRAIQFGTKIAKLTNVECYGSHRKGKGCDSIDLPSQANDNDL
jgi:asparagine synthetase B (glutamine-hydrolysing)